MSNSHSTAAAAGTPIAPGRYVDLQAIEPVEFVPGMEFRPVLGERTMVNFVHFVHFEPNTEAPTHVHEEEQIVIVLDGEFEFDGDVRTMRTGDVAVIPPWVPHGARTKDTRCDEVDVFNPPRQTLLEHAHAQQTSGVADVDVENPVLMEMGLTGRRGVVTGGSKGIGWKWPRNSSASARLWRSAPAITMRSAPPQRSCASSAAGCTTKRWT